MIVFFLLKKWQSFGRKGDLKVKSYIYKANLDLTSLISEDEKKKIKSCNSTLIQVFCGEGDERFQKILSFLVSLFPQATIIGASTDGEIYNEKVLTQSTVISITLFENTKLKIAHSDIKESFSNGVKIAQKLFARDTKLLISFTDGITCNGEEYLKGIASVAPQAKVAGGLAGDNGILQKTTIAIGEQLFHSGAVAVALYSQTLKVHTLYNFGWRSIGIAHTITSSNKNRVFTIDDISAVDFYKKYLGEDIAQLLPAIGIEFPLIMEKNNTRVARAVLKKHPDGSLSFAGNIAQGENVYIGIGSKEEIIKNPITDKHIMTDSFFIYSCMARRRFLPEFIKKEIEPFAYLAPTSGFFTYGEFYTGNKTELLNQTLTAVALSESGSIKKVKKDLTVQKEQKNDINISYLALINILDQTSKNLEEITELRKKDMISSQQAKLAQMGEMVNMIAHQWRQPLNAISASSIKLTMQAQMGLATEDEIIKTMDFIGATTQDMSKTINDFMNFTKPTDKKVDIKFQEIIDNILRMMGAQLKNHNINLIQEIEENLVISTFNKDLKHIIINLFANARDILDEKEIPNKEIKLRAFAKGKDCIIEVSDNAGGIPENAIDKIFNPYFTTKKQGKGTGLGLYMSKKILTETIGGTIDVCNTQDGAKFTIILESAVC